MNGGISIYFATNSKSVYLYSPSNDAQPRIHIYMKKIFLDMQYEDYIANVVAEMEHDDHDDE